MRRILTEVRNGSFTRELAGEFDNGKPNFTRRGVGEKAELMGQAGAKLRPLMSRLEESWAGRF
jgi:ketol-acid reductoisomerase